MRWSDLTTARLLIRPVSIDDAAAIRQIESDELHQRFMGWSASEERARRSIELAIGQFITHGLGLFAAVRRDNADGGLVGYCGLLPSVVGPGAEVELVCAIGVAYQRQGFASEICTAMLTYAFHCLASSRVIGRVDIDNIASNALVSSLGFVPHGIRWDLACERRETIYVKRRFDPAGGGTCDVLTYITPADCGIFS